MSRSISDAFISTVAEPLPGTTFVPKMVGHVVDLESIYHKGTGVLCLHVIEKGTGWIRYGDREKAVGPGEMFCALPNEILEYWDSDHDLWSYYWMILEGPGALEFVRTLGFSGEKPWLVPRDSGTVLDAFRSAAHALEAAEKTDPYMPASCVLRIASGCRPLAQPDREEKASARLWHVTQVANTHLHNGINVSELAAMARMDRSTLYHLFRRHFGMTPIKWLQQFRIDRAKNLLRNSAGSLEDIAHTCGFADTNYFITVFRKHTGYTPGAYRTSVQSS